MQVPQDVAILLRTLLEQNALLREENALLRAENALLHKEQSLLHERIRQLESSLLYYEHPKNSSNSSQPPCQDPFRGKRTASLREKSGRHPGGQPGHAGSTLEFSSSPDKVIEHVSTYCSVCGNDLSDEASVFVGKRQVIDLPPIVPVITEHRIYSRRCSCGHSQVSTYPQEAHSRVCYGDNLTGLTAYFHSRQYIAFDRMRELYSDIFNLDISSGSLVKMTQRFAAKAGSVYELIRGRIAASPVVGADETGVCINGKNHWAWTFQTPKATFIDIDASRGKKVIDRIFSTGFPQATLVHDCWKPYFKTISQAHQICTAHLLRELKYLNQLYSDEWTKNVTGLLNDALQLKKELLEVDYLQPIEKRKNLELRLDELLQHRLDPKHEKLIPFQNRLTQYRQHLFRFLYQYDVPPDNNASERAVRTFKVKQKVSGLFRSTNGAMAFAVIRSVIDTAIKNSQNVWAALNCVATVGE
jgi:transposase